MESKSPSCLAALGASTQGWCHRDSCSAGYAACVLQGRCSRENCKYLHPPPHLKTQLEINGRNNLIQQKNMAMLAQQMQLANAMMPGAPLQPVVSPQVWVCG